MERKEWQQTFGDWVMKRKDKRVVTVELKAEQDWTGNLFLETWSNRDAFRTTHGWLIKGLFDELFYYFIGCGRLLVFNFPLLREWTKDNCRKFQEKLQERTSQLNKTYGLLVPVRDIPRHIVIDDVKINSDGTHGPYKPPPDISQSPGQESWRHPKNGLF